MRIRLLNLCVAATTCLFAAASCLGQGNAGVGGNPPTEFSVEKSPDGNFHVFIGTDEENPITIHPSTVAAPWDKTITLNFDALHTGETIRLTEVATVEITEPFFKELGITDWDEIIPPGDDGPQPFQWSNLGSNQQMTIFVDRGDAQQQIGPFEFDKLSDDRTALRFLFKENDEPLAIKEDFIFFIVKELIYTGPDLEAGQLNLRIRELFSIAVPEPSALGLCLAIGACFVSTRRFRQRR